MSPRGDFAFLSDLGVPRHYQIVDPSVEGQGCFRWSSVLLANLTCGFYNAKEPVLRAAIDDAISKAPSANSLARVKVHFQGRCYRVQGAAARIEGDRTRLRPSLTQADVTLDD